MSSTEAPHADQGAEKGSESKKLSLQELFLAGIGWVSLGVEAIDELADDVARRVGRDRAEVRAAVSDTLESWRREAERRSVKRTEVSDRALERLGLVRREEIDDLTLRLAQVEHRLRLLEKATPDGA